MDSQKTKQKQTNRGITQMKDSKAKDIELERIRKETEMKAEAFYQKYNILPVQKEKNCVIAPQEDEVLYTVFSNKTTNLY